MPESMPARRRGSRGPAPAHSPDAVAAAAVDLADRVGLAATTVRAVAEALGTAPAALYRYVDSRADLVARMVETALADLDEPAGTGDAVDDLVALTASQVALLRRHPWLVDALTTVPPGPRALDALERGLRVLEHVPAGGATKLEALAMLTGVATLLARSAVEPDPRTLAAVASGAAARPHLAAAIARPGAAASADELLRRTVTALVRGLLDPT